MAFTDTTLPPDAHPEDNVADAARSDADGGQDPGDPEFRRFIAGTPGLVWLADAQGHFIEASRGIRDLVGRTREYVTDEDWLGVVHPEDVDRAVTAWAEVVTIGRSLPTEYRCRVLDGSHRWFLFAATELRDAEGRRTGFWGTAIDRHEARLAEEEREAAQRELMRVTSVLRSAQQLGRIGAWSYDADSGLVTWSDELCDLHEVPRGFCAAPETGMSFYLPEDRPVIQELFGRCANDGVAYDTSLRIVTATGRIVWCRTNGQAERDESGRVVGVVGAFQDIDAQKKVELALRESEERFRVLSEATSDVILDWVPASGDVWWSGEIERVVGVDARSLSERGLEAVVARLHPDDADRARDQLREAIDGRIPRWSDVVRAVHEDGRTVDIEISGRVLLDAEGRGERLVVSFVDITDRRAMERRLTESHHLESLGQLTGGIAHDINNLLAVVLGNAELLADRVDADVSDQVTMIRDAAVSGGNLVSRLLSFARRRSLEPVHADAVELVRSSAELAQRALGELWEIRVDVGHEPLPVLVDPTEFESALLNLCINARDALPNGGVVEISARLVTSGLDGEDDERVVMEVRDHGAGMAEDVRRRAFEPFFTTKVAGAGSGLGLSMVYGFAKQSGGDVVLQSSPGAGTAVGLSIPLDRSGEVDHAREAVDETSSRSLRVLLVEDDDAVRTVTKAQLRALGHQVTAVRSSAEALAALESDPAVDLLLTDVVMPGGMDGHELAAVVTRSRPGLPVVYASGYAPVPAESGPAVPSRSTALLKPYRRADLIAAIERVIASGEPDEVPGP